MKNHKQLLMDFYLNLLALPVSTPGNNFANLRTETLRCLARELDTDIVIVAKIFERMAREDENIR